MDRNLDENYFYDNILLIQVSLCKYYKKDDFYFEYNSQNFQD